MLFRMSRMIQLNIFNFFFKFPKRSGIIFPEIRSGIYTGHVEKELGIYTGQNNYLLGPKLGWLQLIKPMVTSTHNGLDH